MKQLFVMAVVAGLLAAASTQQSFAQQYGGSGGTGASEVTLQRCAELNIPTAQCNDNAVLQAERMQIAESSAEKGSGTSMIATELGQMILFIGLIGGIFGGIAAAFYVMGRKTKQIPA